MLPASQTKNFRLGGVDFRACAFFENLRQCHEPVEIFGLSANQVGVVRVQGYEFWRLVGNSDGMYLSVAAY